MSSQSGSTGFLHHNKICDVIAEKSGYDDGIG